MNGGAERRRFLRYRVALPSQVRVPLPEFGSATLVFKATIEDLSCQGAKVFAPAVKKEHASVLLHARRKCSLLFTVPENAIQSVFLAEIAWVDLRADMNPPQAYLGLDLIEMSGEDRERLARYLDSLAKKVP